MAKMAMATAARCLKRSVSFVPVHQVCGFLGLHGSLRSISGAFI
jgi:hypothetical protein